MEYTFWLDQDDWKQMMTQACQALLAQLPLELLEGHLNEGYLTEGDRTIEGYPIEEDEKTQQAWVYEYILAHKLVRQIYS